MHPAAQSMATAGLRLVLMTADHSSQEKQAQLTLCQLGRGTVFALCEFEK